MCLLENRNDTILNFYNDKHNTKTPYLNKT